MERGSRKYAMSTTLVLMLLLGAFFVVATSNGSASQAGDYTYTVSGSPLVATITDYTGTGGAITIPSTLGGYPTEVIGDYAFAHCISLTTVTIPSSVKTIGYYAFYSCTALTSVGFPSSIMYIMDNAFNSCTALTSMTIPDNVIYIGFMAFASCTKLTSVTIPASVTTYGERAFASCTSLTSIEVETANWVYASVDGVLYTNDEKTLIQYPGGKTGAFTVPSGVTTVGNHAFNFCNFLTSVTIPASVLSIDSTAFYSCTEMTAIDVHPSNPNYASVDGVLYDKALTTLIQYPSGKAGTFNIPNGVITIWNYAFYSCSKLTSVTIGSGVTTIAMNAFNHCTALTSINVDTSNLKYASIDGVLYQAEEENLISILIQYPSGKAGTFNIPNGVTTIGGSAFASCTSLTSITIPRSVTTIGDDVFLHSSALTSINVATSNLNYTSIDGVLYNKNITKLIHYPGGKTGAFTIPTGVTSIGIRAFYECTFLTSVTIGRDMDIIGEEAFAQCTALTSVIFKGLVAPTEYGLNWIHITGAETRGHAFAASNLPAPGTIFNGLRMGSVLPEVPSIPTDLSTTPGNAQTVLTWSAPADDGGSAITNYMVYRSAISTGIYSLVASPLGLNYTDTGLTNGQTYWYKVSAVNAAGEGAMTTFVSSTPRYRVPDAPTGLTAIPGIAQVTLNWIAPNDNGGSAVTGYKLYRSTTSNGTYALIALPTALTYVDTGLTNGQTYWYNVSAVNAAGEGAKTALVSSTPNYDLPDAPTGLTSAHGISEVRLNWAAPVVDGGTPITGYKVYRSISFEGTYALIASPSITNYTNTGLTNGQTYWYKVSAVNAQGEGPQTAAISSTPATVPSAQQDLQSTPGTAQATITWQTQASDGGSPITGYKLYRSTTSNGTYSLLAYVSGLTFIDTGLAGGQTYWYKLSAVNEVGEGIQSSAFSVIVPQTVAPTTDNTIVILLEAIAIATVLVVVLILLRKGKL